MTHSLTWRFVKMCKACSLFSKKVMMHDKKVIIDNGNLKSKRFFSSSFFHLDWRKRQDTVT